MIAIVLAGTHERAVTSTGVDVPLPLLDVEGEPYLTSLVRKLHGMEGLQRIVVVTNDAIFPALEAWAEGERSAQRRVEVLGDGTHEFDERRGAIGDLMFALKKTHAADDVLVVGGDNWFTYDLAEFARCARSRSPAVLVTPFRVGWRCSRFGMVRLSDDGCVEEFDEKPELSEAPWKAACVYYLSAADLGWLDTFARDQSTVCSPGYFFAWLTARTRVHAVKMTATWYDVAASHGRAERGPDTLKLRGALAGLMSSWNWEAHAARQLRWVSSYDDLLEVLHDDDPNRRIVAAEVLGRAGDLLSEEGHQRVVRGLLELLSDGALNEYGYGAAPEEEEFIVRVSSAAAEGLVHLGYAKTVDAVLARARNEGLDIVR